MIGAIIGDVVGSRFEFDNYKSKDFEMFHTECDFTDDSVMTLAIAKALTHHETITDYDAFKTELVEVMYKYSKEENANDLLAYLARICIALKEADMTVPELIPEESGYINEDDGYDESDDYDYCDDCDCFDECYCDSDCDSCDECFDCDEAEEYEAPVFDVEKVIEEIGDMVRSFEEKYGILIAVEGIYSEYPSGERHRVA